jgi:hypothetical protein
MKTALMSLKIGIAMAIVFAVSITQVKAFTATASGNWSSSVTWGGVAPGASVSNQDIIIPAGITVNLDMNVVFAGLLNSFAVNGTLSNTNNYSLTMGQGTLSGAGTVDIHMLQFTSLLSSITFTGQLSAESFRNAGATLSLSGIVNVSDTLDLKSGTIALNLGANFTPQANSTIKIDSGSISINGGVFNSGVAYNVMYVGSSKSAGVEMNTVSLGNLYLRLNSNTQVLTSTNNLVVNGLLNITRGTLNISGGELAIRGNLILSNGTALQSNATSGLTIDGATSLTSGLMFTAGSQLQNLTVDNSTAADVRLLSAITVVGGVNLVDGTLSMESGSSLNLGTNAMLHVEGGALALNGGTFDGGTAYNVEYTGMNNTTGIELSDAGLHNVTLALASGASEILMGSDVTLTGAMNMTGGKWNLNGHHLTLQGTFAQASVTKFVGNSASMLSLEMAAASMDTLYFDLSNQTLQSLRLDLPVGSIITLGSDLWLNQDLTLTGGKLDIANHNLVMQSTASIVGATDLNYVATSGTGKLEMTVNSGSTFVTFPIGTLTSYSPAMIQQAASGSTGIFLASTQSGFLAQGTSGFNYATTGTVVNRTWLIEAASGVAVNMNLKLGWTASAEVNGFNRAQAYVSHFTNLAWDGSAAASATAGANGTFEVMRSGLVSLSPFAVADTALALSAPELLVPAGFSLYPNPAQNELHVAFAGDHKGICLDVLDLTGKVLLHSTTHDLDVSMLPSGCYLLKASDNVSNHVSVKRFVKI